ncbi:hypothetical protein niasHS_008007 [Heterodera schachtii]|uniref:Uncharacterized protein n=1 Tax=Heterodera schachtii TaxID=97005 RepID=A0ABD2JCP8_HETSC
MQLRRSSRVVPRRDQIFIQWNLLTIAPKRTNHEPLLTKQISEVLELASPHLTSNVFRECAKAFMEATYHLMFDTAVKSANQGGVGDVLVRFHRVNVSFGSISLSKSPEKARLALN